MSNEEHDSHNADTEGAPGVHTHPFRIRPIQDETRQVDLLARTKERALDPAIFDDHPPFFWRGEFSNSLLDSYFTFMNDKTLTNYAADAQAGIAFLRGHQHYELPLGQSLTGIVETVEDRKRTVADFYTITGLPDTDDLIRRMKSGIARDLSVGFHGGREICTLCGNNYFSWDCKHLRGLIYEEEVNGVVVRRLATVEIDDAHASEASAVFDGATPKAEVLKTERMIQDGRVSPDEIRILEERYRVRLPQPKRTFKAATPPTDRRKTVTAEEQVKQLRTVFNVADDGNLLAAAEKATADLDSATTRIAELEPLAEDGRTFRKQAVEDALKHGVRAYGDTFEVDKKRTFLESLPLATVQEFSAEWKRLGDARFPGGRKTTDDAQPQNPAKDKDTQPARRREVVPQSAYKV